MQDRGLTEVTRHSLCYCFPLIKGMTTEGEKLKGYDYEKEIVQSKGCRIKSSRLYPESYLTPVCLAFPHG